MDAKRAEYLLHVARKQQHIAFTKWNALSPRTPELIHEQARQECAEWARAGDELYTIWEQHETKGNKK